MHNLYLGSEIKEHELKKTLLNVKNKTDFTIKENPDFDNVIGDLLNKGEVVALCRVEQSGVQGHWEIDL